MFNLWNAAKWLIIKRVSLFCRLRLFFDVAIRCLVACVHIIYKGGGGGKAKKMAAGRSATKPLAFHCNAVGFPLQCRRLSIAMPLAFHCKAGGVFLGVLFCPTNRDDTSRPSTSSHPCASLPGAVPMVWFVVWMENGGISIRL